MKKILILVLVISIGIMCIFIKSTYASSGYGSSGEEVKQIQTKLKEWGYYDGDIDGIYGTKTFNAVKKFQSSNGLDVDGVAGSKTLSALRYSNVK